MPGLSILMRPSHEKPQTPFIYIEGRDPQSLGAESAADFSAKLRVFLDDLRHFKYLDHLYFIETPDLNAKEKEKFRSYQKAASQVIALIKSSLGSFEDSMLGVQNLFKNIDIALNKPDLKHISLSKPFDAIVVSAGPSLDLEFDILRKIQNDYLIIAVDAAFKTLLNQGITPHLVTAVERDDYSIPFFKNLPHTLTTGLVAHALVDRKIFLQYPGPIATALKFTGPSLWLPFDRTKFWTGSSSAHLAFRTAASLGAKRIALVGQDLCFHPDTLQSHTTVEDYPDWSKHSTLEDRKKESSVIEAEGNTRERVYTKPTWFMFANDFQIILNETPTPTVNTSKLGMKIPNLPFGDLEIWVSKGDQKKITIQIPSENPFLEEDKKRLLKKQSEAIEALQMLKSEIETRSDYEKFYREITERPHFLELVFELVFKEWVAIENKGDGYKNFLLHSKKAIDGVLEALSFKI